MVLSVLVRTTDLNTLHTAWNPGCKHPKTNIPRPPLLVISYKIPYRDLLIKSLNTSTTLAYELPTIPCVDVIATRKRTLNESLPPSRYLSISRTGNTIGEGHLINSTEHMASIHSM